MVRTHGKKKQLYRAMLFCDCAALRIHVMLPSNAGEERGNFTEEFSGKRNSRKTTKETQPWRPGGGDREVSDKREASGAL